MKKRKLLKLSFVVFGLLIVVGCQLNGYQASPQVEEIINAQQGVKVSKGDYWKVLPKEKKNTGFIFYQGARVEIRAYLPLAVKIAKAGYPVFLPRMPLDLAVLKSEAASEIIEDYSELEWTIGGHSLGGAMAARFAAQNSDQVSGLVLLAAYPASGDDLSKLDIEVLSITGEKDGIINKNKLQKRKNLLPKETDWVEIKGGNHSQFGYYGLQDGDSKAEISRKRQVAITAQEIIEFLKFKIRK